MLSYGAAEAPQLDPRGGGKHRPWHQHPDGIVHDEFCREALSSLGSLGSEAPLLRRSFNRASLLQPIGQRLFEKKRCEI